MNYILEGKTPKPCDNLLKWARWFERADRVVQKTRVGRLEVSTVFLGTDHRFGGNGPPLLFETMIFGGQHDEFQERYSTWEEAEAGHAMAVAIVSKRLQN